MLKVKKMTYGAKLTSEIKQAIQKIEEEKNKTNNKTKINSIDKKRIAEVSIRKWNIKKKC